MILIRVCVDFCTTSMSEKTTLAMRPVYRDVSKGNVRYSFTDLDGEEEGEEERADHLKKVGPSSHPPDKQNIVGRFFQYCETRQLGRDIDSYQA